VVDETATFTPAAWGSSEDHDLMAPVDQPGGEVMNLHLDSAQAGQIAVGQQRDLHRTTLA
jgi:hypothetical protein